MTFETFWTDPRIPKRMKRCGPQPVRAALQKRPDKDGIEERILASLPGYERNKKPEIDYCMLSTYINQERDKVEWDEMDEPVSEYRTTDRLRLSLFIRTGRWDEDANISRPLSIEEAKARLNAMGAYQDYELRLVKE